MLIAANSFWMPGPSDLFGAGPDLALVGTIAVILVAALILGRSPGRAAGLAALGALATLLLALWVGSDLDGGRGIFVPDAPDATPGMLIVDDLSLGFRVILAVFLLGVIALAWTGPGRTETHAPEFFALLLGSGLGMAWMVSTANLLMMVVAIETASIPSFGLVAFARARRNAAEAALKYAVFGTASTAITLYGVSLLYGRFQTLHVGTIANELAALLAAESLPLLPAIGMLCVVCGILFKISAVPFHFWCPDAFQGARIDVATWLSVVSKAAGLLLLARLVWMLATAAAGAEVDPARLAPVGWTLGLIAAVTCTFGNLAAYRQTSVVRLLAYSSIAHAGYMMMATAVLVFAGGAAGLPITAIFIYVVVYLFMNLGAFGVTALVAWSRGGDDSIAAFTGLARRSPWLAVPMVICLISLVGLPPFGGFWAKFWLLYALARDGFAGFGLGWFLFVVAVFNTLISLFYYLRIVKQMALHDDARPAMSVRPSGAALVNLCGFVLLVLWIFVVGGMTSRTDRLAGNLYRGPAPAVQAGASADASP